MSEVGTKRSRRSVTCVGSIACQLNRELPSGRFDISGRCTQTTTDEETLLCGTCSESEQVCKYWIYQSDKKDTWIHRAWANRSNRGHKGFQPYMRLEKAEWRRNKQARSPICEGAINTQRRNTSSNSDTTRCTRKAMTGGSVSVELRADYYIKKNPSPKTWLHTMKSQYDELRSKRDEEMPNMTWFEANATYRRLLQEGRSECLNDNNNGSTRMIDTIYVEYLKERDLPIPEEFQAVSQSTLTVEPQDLAESTTQPNLQGISPPSRTSDTYDATLYLDDALPPSSALDPEFLATLDDYTTYQGGADSDIPDLDFLKSLDDYTEFQW
ncbi:uncharacterized protein L201_007439 [Kwoniella dendrophila CBS 6074]|uniref:HMG box domain-containing protein n=1 Tax=Kwoniella dendrophila CBS 6074 TaxID=1295534 RepID=A0AAX4K4E2_9TREE